MIAKRSIDRVTFTIVVASGIGSYQFQKLGHVRIISINPPSQLSTFDYEITDSDGYGLNGKSAQQGNTTISGDIPVATLCTLNLTNAANGTYKGVLYIDLAA